VSAEAATAVVVDMHQRFIHRMRAYGTRQTFMNLNHKLALALQLRPSGQHLSCVLGLVSHCEAISVGLIYEYIVKPNY
jgi:hypothetical protein